MNNIDRTPNTYPDHYTAADIIADVIWTDEGALRGTVTEAAQALKDSGRLMPAPQIIRTVEELQALDPDTLLIRSAQDWADPQIPMLATEWVSDWEIEPDGIFPLATIAHADQVRAARKALEEA